MDEYLHWIALKNVKGIGEVLYKRLLSHFSSPKEVFEAGPKEFLQIEGISPDTVKLIKSFDDWESVEKELQKIKKLNLRLMVMSDPAYPDNLKNIYNPPPYFYMIGNIVEQDHRSIGIVGSRLSDTYGKKVTEQIAGELAVNGYTVVSGFARGIDTIAHKACLKAGGRTIAVLGSGIDVVYPSENATLYKEIESNGAVISEFAIGTGPVAVNFPRRNRIISGLSVGVLVVQAAQKSGSLITAEFALEQNREVFAIPGNIGSNLSRGTNRLIKKGAKLVNTVDDILEEIEGITGVRKELPRRNEVDIESLENSEKIIYKVLKEGQHHVDQIIKNTGLDSSRVLTDLLNLEIKGIVSQLPGKYFELV